MLPTYSICKIAAETVARFAAREWRIPTIIARLSVPYGDNGGWPWFHLMMMKGGVEIPVHPDGPNLFNPIHEDDYVAQIPRLLELASVPATVVNWGGPAIEHRGVVRGSWASSRASRRSFVPASTRSAASPSTSHTSTRSSDRRRSESARVSSAWWRRATRSCWRTERARGVAAVLHAMRAITSSPKRAMPSRRSSSVRPARP